MANINFFTPLMYDDKTLINTIREKVDDYFFWGGKQVRVVSAQSACITRSDVPLFQKAIKLLSYCTVVIPMFMLVLKVAIRPDVRSFTIIEDNPKTQKLTQVFQQTVVPETPVSAAAAASLSPLQAVPHRTVGTPTTLLQREVFSKEAQKVLDNFYKKPLPQEQDVVVTNLKNTKVRWASLSTEEQHEIIQKNKKGKTSTLFVAYSGPKDCQESVPRWSHGCMHVCRAAIMIHAIADLYKKYDPSIDITDEDIALAQYLTLFHDSARQADGVDVWDDESAENARSYLQALQFEESKIHEAIEALKSKDSGAPKGIIGKLIHDADCLDIMRVYGKNGFKNQYLQVYKDFQDKSGFLRELEELQQEIATFMLITENPVIKVQLETDSDNYYHEVLGLACAKFSMPPNNEKYELPKLTSSIERFYERNKLEKPQASKWIKLIARSKLRALSPQGYTLVTRLVGVEAGVNPSQIVSDSKGTLSFLKFSNDIFSTSAEYGASPIASYITGGLVPIATKYRGVDGSGIMQPYVRMNDGPFAPIHHKNHHFDPEKLSSRQKEQLFVHMIADRIISNYDTHTGQFGIDSNGNVIGFDKGQAFKLFKDRAQKYGKKPEPEKFDPSFYWPPISPNRPVYLSFSEYLRQNPEIARSIITSPYVQEAFTRCSKFTEEQVAMWLNDYGNAAFQQNPKVLYKEVVKRAHTIQEDIEGYFLKRVKP